MQKTPWFSEGQADVMLNYLPLRNVLIQGIKATVKNKALPDSARLCCTPVWSLGLSVSLSLADTVHPEGAPWILPRLDPSRWAYQTT